MSDKTQRIVKAYLEGLHALLDGFGPLLSVSANRKPDLYERAALGTMLHAFYRGVEFIFTRVSADVDQVLPGGDQWHRLLLDSMAQATQRRPAVITSDIRMILAEYLGFRHLFRNLSPLDLDWERMAPLVASVEDTLKRFESELDAFFEQGRKRITDGT